MNIDYLRTAVAIVHADSDADRVRNARALLAVFNPHEPYDDDNPRDPNAYILTVCLDAYIASQTIITRRAVIAACENYYEMT